MLMGLTGQIKEGDQVPLTLTVENAKGEKETIKVEAEARAMGRWTTATWTTARCIEGLTVSLPEADL